PGVLTFEVRSLPIKHYLKKMNIHSLNATADELFHSMGGTPGFQTYLATKYQMGSDAVDIHTGSGLPLHNPRNDSTISCSATVRLIRALDNNLEAEGMDLTDVVMIAGTDAGATYNDGSRALVVKTGTLNDAKNLAGAANTATGEVYFGIFLQNGSLNTVRNVVARMKSTYRMQAINKPGFVWDPLDPRMALRLVSADVGVSVAAN
ncbi:MAG: D-alanyl-D-alanine carboxypeptidase, partial [Bdellovibrionota bacterium]